MIKWRQWSLFVFLGLFLLSLLYWQKLSWNKERLQQITQLAWSIRRGDQSQYLSAAQAAYLEGRFLDCLRLLEQPENGEDRDLGNKAFLGWLYQLPWPEQLLHCQQIETLGQRPRLLARVVSGGYAEDMGKVRIDLILWNKQQMVSLDPPGSKPLSKPEDWQSVEQLHIVHLDRQDEHKSQLMILGKTRDDRVRLDILYGSKQWKRWTLIETKPIKLQSESIVLENGTTYKLFEDEWVLIKS